MWPQGKIVVTFTIAAEGSVTEAVLARTSDGDAGVERCVVDVMRGLRFEPATDAGTIRVTYPFVFLSEGEQPNTCRGVPAVAPVPPGEERRLTHWLLVAGMTQVEFAELAESWRERDVDRAGEQPCHRDPEFLNRREMASANACASSLICDRSDIAPR
jgi:TonB family protein